MNTHSLQRHLVGALASPRFVAGALVTFALLFPACGGTEMQNEEDSLSQISSALGTGLQSFAILAGPAVTCTGGSVDNSVGVNLVGGAVTTCTPTKGTVHIGDAVAQAAYAQFLVNYGNQAPHGEKCTVLTGTLAGITLSPGNYCFPAAATLTGLLTLHGDADDKWNFKIGTSGTGALTGTSFNVAMTGGAKACNVRWWVSQATTMTTSTFQGRILAGAAITLTGGSLNGNAWAKAAVTNTGAAITGCAP